MSQYDYVKTSVDVDKLTQEIQQSIITVSLDHIDLFGSVLSLFFKADLSEGGKAILDTIVANHDGIASPENQVQNVSVVLMNAFASKVLPDGTKLFKRYCGIQPSVSAGENTILYTVPYTQVKITGLDIVYAENLDTVSLYILDTITGTYSTIPNYVLNQFASSINVSKDFYRQESNYDAALYQGMQIKLVYNSQSAKTIGINFNLSEVQS